MMSNLVLALVVAGQSGAAPRVASPDRQKAILAKIQAERAAKSNVADLVGPPLAAVRPTTTYSPTPSRKASRTAGYRRHNAEFQAEQAADAAAQAEYERKMAPFLLEAQRQQSEAATRQYEAELRHRENMDFNDAIRGVTRAKP